MVNYQEMMDGLRANIETNTQKINELQVILIQQRAQYDLLAYLQAEGEKEVTEDGD